MAAEESLPIQTEQDNTFKPIESAPRAGQNISHERSEYTTIKEGLAHILVPRGIPTSTDPKIPKEDAARQSVFYNPIQQFNRDLSVLAIKAFGKDLLLARRQVAEKKRDLANKKRSRQQKRRAEALRENRTQIGENDSGPAGAKRQKMESHSNGDVRIEDPQRLVSNGAAATEDSEGQAHEGSTTLRGNLEENMTQASTETSIIGADNARPQEASTGQSTVNSIQSTGENGERKLPFRILDALSATGLRALRYAQEIPFVTAVTANDMSSKACRSIALNIKHNRLEDIITANTGNAIHHMYGCLEKQAGYDVIDLDPYGSAAPFLDAAVQATNDGGLLCVTCTDSAVFASHGYLEKTFSQYGGLPIKGEHSHEAGIRLILHAVASSAARYGISIEPLLSLSIDYYIRIFIRVRKSPIEVKFLAGKTMMVYSCDSGCGAWQKQFLARNQKLANKDGTPYYKYHFAQGPSADQNCAHCGRKTHLSGPMYGGPIHNPAFIERILEELPNVNREEYPTVDRIEGMLYTARDEITYGVDSKEHKQAQAQDKPTSERRIPSTDPAQVDNHPFFFNPSNLAKVIHCQAPSDAAIRGALRHAGFRVARSHCKPGSIRTDASWSDLWHIMREWVRQKAPLVNPLKQETAGWHIMQQGQIHKSDTGDDPAMEPKSGEERLQEVGEKSGAGSADAAKNDTTTSGQGSKFKVVFDEQLGKDKEGKRLIRYQLAPRANWGPMSRAR